MSRVLWISVTRQSAPGVRVSPGVAQRAFQSTPSSRTRPVASAVTGVSTVASRPRLRSPLVAVGALRSFLARGLKASRQRALTAINTAACTRILCKNTGEEITLSRSETQDWITSAEPEQTDTLTEPQLTRYGFFTAQTGSGEDFGFRAVNDAELYGNIAELRQLYDTYLKPIAATAIGEKTWSSPEEAGDLLMLAEDIAWAVDGISFRETYPDGWIPVNYLVETLSRYFDGIDRRAVVYTVYDFDYASDCMHYTFERDYEAELPRVRVLSAHEQEELLRISYCLYDPCTGEPLPDSSRVLSVRPQEDGSFRYMSNLMA